MTAAVASGASAAAHSVPGGIGRTETAVRSYNTLRTQESASTPQGSGKPRPVRMPVGVQHPGCGGHWSGSRTAHCARCHLTTTGLRAFEAHQRVTRGILQCLPPDKAGLVPVQRPWGLAWSQPGSDDNWWSNDLPTGTH